MKKIVAVLSLLLSNCAFAATVTGTINVNGVPFTGYVAFQLAYPSISSTSLGAASSAVNLPNPSQQIQVINGTFPSQTLPGNDTMLPDGTYYLVTYLDPYRNPIVRAPYVITGSTFDLGQAVPTPITTANVSFLDLLGIRNFSALNASFTTLTFGTGTVINQSGVSNASLINGIEFAAYFNTGGSSTCGIQEAYNALPATGGWIIVPQGVCDMTSAVQLNKYPVALQGYGTGTAADAVNYSTYFAGSILKNNSTSSDMFDITVNNTVTVLGGISFSNMMLVGNSTVGGATGGNNISITGSETLTSYVHDVFLNNVFSGYAAGSGLYLKDNVSNVRANNSAFQFDTGSGLYVTNTETGGSSTVSAEGPRGVILASSDLSRNNNDNIHIQGSQVKDVTVTDSSANYSTTGWGANVVLLSAKASLKLIRDKLYGNDLGGEQLADGFGHEANSNQYYYASTPEPYGIYFNPPSGGTSGVEQLRIEENDLEQASTYDVYIGTNAVRVINYPNLKNTTTYHILNSAAMLYVQLGNSATYQVEAAKLTSGICTAAGSEELCTNTITWPTPFADTNYTAVCSTTQPTGSGTNPGLYQVYTESFTTTSFTAIIQSGSNSAGGTNTVSEIHCIGVHY